MALQELCRQPLGNIKHQESEDALLALLETEQDPSNRTMLCIGLCQLFSAPGVEVVRKQIRSGYDRMIDCLEETLLPVAQVLGIEIPEAEQWQADREEREFRQSDQAAELAELGKRYAAAQAAGIDPSHSFKLRLPRMSRSRRRYDWTRHALGEMPPGPCR